jgi:hypothetical protein
MHVPVHPPSNPAHGSFSIFVAPSSTISEELNNLLVRERGKTLYVCGNFPIILSGIIPNKDKFRVKRAKKAVEILSIIEESDDHLILLEHDRSLYDTNADLIRPIGQLCRKKASECWKIIMVASRQDCWLKKFEPFAHQIKYQEDLIQYLPKKTMGIRFAQSQMTLEGFV